MRFSVYKKTSDNWCGNYTIITPHASTDIDLVEVKFHGNIASPQESVPYYRVSVWGNDDCGMEFDCDNEKLALTKFMEVIGLEIITFDALKQLEFISA